MDIKENEITMNIRLPYKTWELLDVMKFKTRESKNSLVIKLIEKNRKKYSNFIDSLESE